MKDKYLIFNISDDYIRKITNNRQIFNEKDFTLRTGTRRAGSKNSITSEVNIGRPIKHGLYDGKVFGSCYPDRCSCGKITTVGLTCPSCHTTCLSETDRMTRYGYYEASVYYTNSIKAPIILSRLSEIFDRKIKYDTPTFNKGKKSALDILFLCQFDLVPWADGSTGLKITETLTNDRFIGLEGLRGAIKRYAGDEGLSRVNDLMNKLIPITPITYRPFKLRWADSTHKVVDLDKNTIKYRTIIYFDKVYSKLTNPNIEDSSIYKRTIIKGILRQFISSTLSSMTDITSSSRGNLFRTAYSDRIGFGSGRGVIIPDPKLKITEVGIPLFACYELYKDQFIKYLVDEGYSEYGAIEKYKEAHPDTLKEFENYIEKLDKHVLLNRNPTLHKYNIYCLKVKIVKDQCIHLPMLLCASYNGDFDGDELNYFTVPDDLKDYAIANASPKVQRVFAKDHSFLFKFKNEMINGLILASKVIPDGEPRKYTVTSNLDEDYENATIEVDTAIEVGNKITSYGRFKISEIIGKDLDELYPENEVINAKNVNILYWYLQTLEDDRMADVLQKLQEFCLKVVYYNGETALSLEDMLRQTYSGISDKFGEDMEKILNDPDLSNDDKRLRVEDLHNKFLKDYDRQIDTKVKTRINESGRMKMSSLYDLISPQVIYNSDGTTFFTKNTLLLGLTEEEWVHHAINNRSLLALKFESVPASGYLTRQLATLGQYLIMRDEIDVENEGIWIARKNAEGRTTVDGELLGRSNSDELVKVRSLITTQKTHATPDMISQINKPIFDEDGVGHIGTELVISFTEAMTQKGLSLKHGGSLRMMTGDTKFYADRDLTIEWFDGYFIIDGKETYPISSTCIYDKNKTSYKKDDLVMMLNFTHTFSYTLDCVTRICKACGNVSLGDIKDTVEKGRVMVLTDEATIHYDFDKKLVMLDDEVIKMDPRALYHYPDGTKLKFGDKFRSGVEDISALRNLSYLERFYVFRSAMYDLLPGMTDEIIEVIYYLINNKEENRFIGVLRSNTDNTSFVSSIAYGYARKAIGKAIEGMKEVVEDSYSRVIFNPFLTNELLGRLNGKINTNYDEE